MSLVLGNSESCRPSRYDSAMLYAWGSAWHVVSTLCSTNRGMATVLQMRSVRRAVCTSDTTTLAVVQPTSTKVGKRAGAWKVLHCSRRLGCHPLRVRGSTSAPTRRGAYRSRRRDSRTSVVRPWTDHLAGHKAGPGATNRASRTYIRDLNLCSLLCRNRSEAKMASRG
jgi:hypothetical protein